MANWNGLQLTNKGIALQAKVQAGTQLHITKLKLGSGVVPSGTDIKTLTDLIAPEQNLGIGGKEAVGDYCKISSTISNTGLEAGYYVRELGVFAQDPDDGEILYMYTTDGAPDYLPAGGGSTVISQEFSVMIAVDDTDNIVVDIDPAALATMGYVQLQIQEHNTDTTAHKDFTGATAEAAGKRGMVPAPAAGTANRYLKADGTWGIIDTMNGASSSAAGSAGLVPAPAAGDQNKALFGDATYKQVVQKVNGVVANNEGDVSLRNALYCHDASEFMEELGTAGWNSKGVYAVTFANTDNFPQKPSPYCVVFNLAETPNNGYAIQIAVNILNGDIYVRGTNNQKEIDDVPFEKLVRNNELLAMLPIGTILPFAGGTIPYGFLATNGAAISRTTYGALFSTIGTTYGSGDGSTTFNLPLIEDNRFLEFASTAGTKKNAGLPNITGTFRYDVYATDRTGAFSTGSANDFRTGTSQTGTIGQDIQTVFDASDSNSIYGGSTTVQPKSLTVRAIIKY